MKMLIYSLILIWQPFYCMEENPNPIDIIEKLRRYDKSSEFFDNIPLEERYNVVTYKNVESCIDGISVFRNPIPYDQKNAIYNATLHAIFNINSLMEYCSQHSNTPFNQALLKLFKATQLVNTSNSYAILPLSEYSDFIQYSKKLLGEISWENLFSSLRNHIYKGYQGSLLDLAPISAMQQVTFCTSCKKEISKLSYFSTFHIQDQNSSTNISQDIKDLFSLKSLVIKDFCPCPKASRYAKLLQPPKIFVIANSKKNLEKSLPFQVMPLNLMPYIQDFVRSN